MSIFDTAYDAMTWEEVCYRLPGELSVSALKRRITNLDTLKMFFDHVGHQPSRVPPLKEHINTLIASTKIDDLLNTFDQNYHPTLFNWMTPANAKRFKEADPSKLGLKFLFNLTDSKDQAGLEAIMDKILAEPELVQSHLRSVLSRADDSCVSPLLTKLSLDVRPEVRAALLSIPGSNAYKVSDLQKIIGLKALAKCPSSPLKSVNILGITAFSALKPAERLTCLERYMECFPTYHKMQVFDTVPSEEEITLLLFAGCLDQNERVTKVLDRYKKITEMDPPKESEDDE